ncbi:MAG: VOC family protein [Alteromonadaceae bacterium]|nr:VOC family protein [Alteromonadaceae bacterium]
MKLGAFSVSLAVKDLQKSLDFYQTLGFAQFAGEAEQGWVIVKNEATTIGLFQGMFEDNILTFNPGWDQNCQKQNDFMDVREIEQNLLKAGINVVSNTKETTSGPAHIILEDPDGNKLMLDQHV